MTSEELAAIVEKSRAETAIAELRKADLYDRSRRIESIDETHLAVPVTAPRPVDGVIRYETGVATSRRLRTLADHLRDRGLSEAAIDEAPTSYARIGDIVVINEPVTVRPTEVGEALLALHGDAKTVLSIVSIDDQRRRPSLEHIAGQRSTRTVHREHGIEYELDLAEIMFSPGNKRERARMGEVVDTGERVVDLCAGIGYFALPMGAGGARVTAIERTPTTFRWLSNNVTRNDLDEAISPVNGDCRDCIVRADRAVIGHLPVHDCRDDPARYGGGYLDTAVAAVADGWIHVHGIAWAGEHTAALEALCTRLERRGASVSTASVRRVKGMAPRTDHIVMDVEVAGR